MKKIIALLLALALVIGLVACGNTPAETPDDGNTPAGNETPNAGNETPNAGNETPAVDPAYVQGVTDTTIYIGNTAATTGGFAIVGVPFNAGLEATLDWYNANGGFGGKNIELVHYDDGFDAAQGMTYTKTLVEDDKVFALVGHFGTNTVAATLDYVKATGIPTAYIVTGISALYGEGLTGNDACYFPVQPIYDGEGRMLLARAMASTEGGYGLGGKKIGVLATTDDAGAGMLTGIKRQAQEGSVDLVVQEVDAAATDYINAVSYLMANGCDVVIAAMNQVPLATALSSMAAVDYNVPVISSYVNASPTTLGALVDAGFITADRPVYTTTWLDTGTEAGMNEYLEFANIMLAWEAANGIDSTDPTQTYVLNSYAMCGYICAMNFIHGLNQLEANGQELNWTNYIAAMESAPFHIPMGGDINYANGDRIGVTALAMQCISLEAVDGVYALQTVSPLISLDDVWSHVE